MRSRKPSDRRKKLHERLKRDRQVQRWIERLTGDPEAKPTDLSEEQLEFVYAEVLRRRERDFDDDEFEKAMKATQPVVAAPTWTGHGEDMRHVFTQPEMQRFWHAWDGPHAKTAPKVDYAPAKAVMATFAITGANTHFDDALESYEDSRPLQAVFADLEGRPVPPPAYSSLMRHIEKAGRRVWWAAMKENIALVKVMRSLCPGMGIGERGLIDASPIPAWVPQRSAGGDKKLEELYRSRTPEAGYRCYGYHRSVKSEIGASDSAKTVIERGNVKSWRGYYVAVIVDQASGLPLVWSVFDAKQDEAQSLIVLLRDLFELWPDCPMTMLAGDSAYDEDWACRLCEVDYGIAPIFRLHPSRADQKAWNITRSGGATKKPSAKKKHAPAGTGKELKAGDTRDGRVHGFTGQGRLVCAVHGKVIDYESYDRPARTRDDGKPLYPGQSSDERQFRLRGNCSHTDHNIPPCGRIGLQMQHGWSTLTRYPHHPHGRPELYAMRQAMLVRLNQVESLFNRLKSAGLGVQGANRPRVLAKTTVEACISLAFLGMTALAVADLRQQTGCYPVPLTPAPHEDANGAAASGSDDETEQTNPQADAPRIAAVAPLPATSPVDPPGPVQSPLLAVVSPDSPVEHAEPTCAATPAATPLAQQIQQLFPVLPAGATINIDPTTGQISIKLDAAA